MHKTITVPPVLIKVAEEKNLIKLQKMGQIYFGTFEGYRKQEKEEFDQMLKSLLRKEKVNLDKTDFYRRDPLEGLERRFSGRGSLRFKDLNQNDITINVPDIKLNFFQNGYTHLYCLYAIPNIMNHDFKINSKMLKFGKSALIITKPLEFLERISRELNSSFDMDYVNYYDKAKMKDGQYNIFQKPDIFEYQNEFRIATNLFEGSSVFIGDISDISILVESKALLDIEYQIKH